MEIDPKALEAAIKETGGGYVRPAPLILAYLRARSAQGYVEVPVEPTPEMIRAGAASLDYPSVYMGGPSHQNQRNAPRSYRAMLSARPHRKETPYGKAENT